MNANTHPIPLVLGFLLISVLFLAYHFVLNRLKRTHFLSESIASETLLLLGLILTFLCLVVAGIAFLIPAHGFAKVNVYPIMWLTTLCNVVMGMVIWKPEKKKSN